MSQIPTIPYNPANWYWAVGGSTTQVFSSAIGDYVGVTDPTFLAWVESGGFVTRIDSEVSLGETLAPYQIRPVSANVLDGYKESHANKLTVEVIAKVLFRMANDIRALQGLQALTANQFKTFLKGLM